MSEAVPYRSQQYPFTAGGNIPVQLAFLDAALGMSFPVVERFLLQIDYDVDTAGVDGDGAAVDPRVLAEFFDRVWLKDVAGDRVNCRGSSLYLANKVEYGKHGGPSNLYFLPGGTAGVTGTFWMEITFTPWKGRRRNDYGLSLREFNPGGQLELNWRAQATMGGNGTDVGGISAINSAVVTVWALVREERTAEAKPRMCLVEKSIDQPDFQYPVGGKLRWAMAYAGEEAEDTAAPWGAQNVICSQLDYLSFPSSLLEQLALVESSSGPIGWLTGVNTGLSVPSDPIANDYAVPLMAPRMDQKIGTMFELNTVQFKTDISLPDTSPVMVICYISERQQQCTARTFKAKNLAQLAGAIATRAQIKTAAYGTDESGLAATTWAPQVSTYLPFKLKEMPAKK